MRNRFDAQLNKLNNSLIEMGALVEVAIGNATHAFETQDAELAKTVLAADDLVDTKERDIEARCLKLLLSQQPVARDLRQISTALKMITDLERIGDHAIDICELSLFLSDQNYILNPENIPVMASVTQKMVTESIDAFVKKDLKLAKAVIARDDVVDELFGKTKTELIKLVHSNADLGEQAFDLLQIAKYYERIGDHAVNVAEWVIFSITGKHKDTQVL
ncbi:MAG: phosphate signaling complex protein PhoU [Oscillospiraceae bacterium]|jgi:phosphate transport system protein|nr:phosphate signaling complex protein PhoU [Oscillospiraceae bacterium]